MHRMELRKVSASVPITVNRPFEFVYQPVAINTPIRPLDEALVTHDDDIVALYNWLDRSAQGIVSEALKSDPEIGTEVFLSALILFNFSSQSSSFHSSIGLGSFPGQKKLL